MKKIYWNIFVFSLLATIVTLTLTGCNQPPTEHHDGDIEIKRFEQTLFETSLDEMPQALAAFKKEYDSPLLNNYPDNPQFMADVAGFVSDSVVRHIYSITSRRYGELYWLEKELTQALQRAHKLDEEIDFQHFATFVSAMFDYNERVNADRESGSVLISIDQYAIGDMEKYGHFGLPVYLVQLSDSAFLASDIMAAIAECYVKAPDANSATMLDYMVMYGKVLYFLDQVMPDKADHLKIRYTPEQLQWCQDNESMIWAYFIQHNLLYEKDFSRFHNFVDEAPKTNAFKDSAPRTTHYIGWQIVRNYMKNNKCTLQELFALNDSQAILQGSQYKP